MLKRFQLLIVLGLIISVVNPSIVYSRSVNYDIYYSVDGQEALLIGKVFEINTQKEVMKVEIVRLVSGTLEYKDNMIDVQFDKLGKLNIGDEVLLSLKSVNKKGALYKIAYECACYTVECTDDKKIKILQRIMDGSKEITFFEVILQWLCNTGEELAPVNRDDGSAYYREDGENGELELVFDERTNKYYQDSFSPKFTAPDMIKEERMKEIRSKLISVSSLIFIISSLLVCYRIRKRKQTDLG